MSNLLEYRRSCAVSTSKVNLGKTVLVSLSGVRHSWWHNLAMAEGIAWHDSHSVDSARYLGYPLYHTQDRLLVSLDEIKIKILSIVIFFVKGTCQFVALV
jgi:hypothetical protein